jgi:hypothetical protein
MAQKIGFHVLDIVFCTTLPSKFHSSSFQRYSPFGPTLIVTDTLEFYGVTIDLATRFDIFLPYLTSSQIKLWPKMKGEKNGILQSLTIVMRKVPMKFFSIYDLFKLFT